MPAPTRRRTAAGAVHPAPAKAPRRVAPNTRRQPLAAAIDMTKIRVTPEWVDITDVKPYEFNARKNAKAVDAVAKSIKEFGFLVPIVIDADGNLAAGHTRIEAAKKLGMTELLALRAEHLTPDQFDSFRLVDNKVGEIADWDTDLLAQEMNRLMGLGQDMSGFGWSSEEIDCLSSTVTADCLSLADLSPAETEEEESARLNPRRGPQSTRMVLGDITIFVPSEAFNAWTDGIRRMHNFDRAEVHAEILNRLGILI